MGIALRCYILMTSPWIGVQSSPVKPYVLGREIKHDVGTKYDFLSNGLISRFAMGKLQSQVEGRKTAISQEVFIYIEHMIFTRVEMCCSIIWCPEIYPVD